MSNQTQTLLYGSVDADVIEDIRVTGDTASRRSTYAGGGEVKAVVAQTAATLALAPETHSERTVVAKKADGITFTLPAATGSGAKYRIVVGTTITSVGLIVNVTGNDTLFGLALGLDGDGVPANAWAASGGNNKVTLDGSTQGGVAGDELVFEDIVADKWAVQARLQQSGTEATPFSTV